MGAVNEADQHTTETPEQRPTRGNRLYPRVTSFRSRRGSLTDPQQECWDRRWPELGRDVGDELLDIDGWFGRSAPTVLEIGSGTGTAAVAMAQDEPHVNLIAIEVYKPGIAQTLQRIERTYDTDRPVHNLTDAMTSDRDRFRRYFHGMLAEGVFVAPSQFEAGFLSTAHTTEDVEQTLSAARKVLATLTPREEKVLKMRFGIGEKSTYTLEEIGQLEEVTRERVRQVETGAIAKLRQPARAKFLRPFSEN